ncbi:MAG: helix-turn-helix domain-containing protein [Massilia sp.]
MAKIYEHLATQERAVVMTMRADLCSIRSIAKRLCRLASTISRELKRTSGSGVYDANAAHAQCHARRLLPPRRPKLHVDGALFQVVRHHLKLLWSPQQIALKLKVLWPDNSEKSVSHETIYNAIYLHPRGELKRELIACLRHHNLGTGATLAMHARKLPVVRRIISGSVNQLNGARTMGIRTWLACISLATLTACATAVHAPDNAALKRQVADTERAFAATMKARDHAAFTTFLSDEAVFYSGPTPLHGKQLVAAFWKKLYDKPEAPFSWEPDEVEVLASGTLAMSSGPVYNRDGKLISRFSSIWRQEAPGVWKIVFDHGWEVCDCAKPAP